MSVEQRWIAQELIAAHGKKAEDGFYDYDEGWSDKRVMEVINETEPTVNVEMVRYFRNKAKRPLRDKPVGPLTLEDALQQIADLKTVIGVLTKRLDKFDPPKPEGVLI